MYLSIYDYSESSNTESNSAQVLESIKGQSSDLMIKLLLSIDSNEIYYHSVHLNELASRNKRNTTSQLPMDNTNCATQTEENYIREKALFSIMCELRDEENVIDNAIDQLDAISNELTKLGSEGSDKYMESLYDIVFSVVNTREKITEMIRDIENELLTSK